MVLFNDSNGSLGLYAAPPADCATVLVIAHVHRLTTIKQFEILNHFKGLFN